MLPVICPDRSHWRMKEVMFVNSHYLYCFHGFHSMHLLVKGNTYYAFLHIYSLLLYVLLFYKYSACCVGLDTKGEDEEKKSPNSEKFVKT